MKFNLKLAEIPLMAEVKFTSTERFCSDYITQENPLFCVSVTEDSLRAEKEKAGIIAEENLLFSDAYYERIALYREIAEYLPVHDTFLFHGSCVCVDGEGYIFTAKSGTGKSTHTRLWRELLKDKAVMVNDDKPLLKIIEKKVFAYGTPWMGKHNIGSPIHVPLKAICILERSVTNRISEISFSEALPMLFQQSFHPKDKSRMEKTLELILTMEEGVRFYQLGCNMESDAAVLSYNAMKG